ncbi:MAG: restriction endonuclease subunit S [Gemmatimonadales bacterium]
MSPVPQSLLGDIADLRAGVGFPLDLQGRSSGDYPVVKVGDISRVGRSGEAVISSADHFVDEADLARLRAEPIPAGSVLFAKIGEAIRQNHRVIAGCPLLVDNNAMAAIPTPQVESRYLYHFLRTVDFYALASATTVPALRKSELERLPVPLPTLPEQRRIVEILDKADALRAKRRVALAQLDTLIQSIFLDLFGDPATNPKGWPTSRVGGVAKQIRGVTYSKGEASKEPRTGYLPILRAGNISDGDIVMDDLVFVPAERVAERQRLRSNDVLIAASSGSLDVVGKAARVHSDMPVGFGAFCKVLRPGGNVDPTFFAAFFSTQYYRHRVSELAAGININNLRNEHLDDLPLPTPPMELQRSFAAIVAAASACRASCRASLGLLLALSSSLQHRAFRGEL